MQGNNTEKVMGRMNSCQGVSLFIISILYGHSPLQSSHEEISRQNGCCSKQVLDLCISFVLIELHDISLMSSYRHVKCSVKIMQCEKDGRLW